MGTDEAGTQELRIAPALSGGVSLAIWMGGVARELNLLERASRKLPSPDDPHDRALHERYAKLSELLDVRVELDVLSGTSAGGINALLLGVARARELDLAAMRGLWLKLGDFEDLIRDPAEDKPTSLLQGDGKLLAGLRDGLDDLAREAPREPGEAPSTQVLITTTLLGGEPSAFTDAFGTQVHDVDHLGLFTFDQDALAADDLAALATAGRSTASFPFAFEAGFVGRDATGEDRPAMVPFISITRAHWVADGGLLVNKPLAPLLECIFRRPAARQVRRVVLHITPSSGVERVVDPADLDAPPSLPQTLMRDLGAVLSQSIGAELRALRKHADGTDAVADARFLLARTSPGAAASAAAARLRVEAAARSIAAAVIRELAALESPPPAWVTLLGPGKGLEASLRGESARVLAGGWADKPTDWDGLAAAGPDSLREAKATVIALVRAGLVLVEGDTSGDQRRKLGALLKRIHEEATVGEVDVRECARDAVTATAARTLDPGAADAPPADPLAAAADVAQALIAAQSADAWRTLAKSLLELRSIVAVAAVEAPDVRPRERRPRAEADLAVVLNALTADGAGAREPQQVALALHRLAAAARATQPVDAPLDQPVELVQVSADTRTALDGGRRRTAEAKLTGKQLRHFGAFYHPAWRANDWMWGRVDGAGWLVHLLLDPRRIRAMAARAGQAPATWLLDGLRTRGLVGQDVPSDVLTELRGHLDDAGEQRSLPTTALWLAEAFQRHIVAAELPMVAASLDDDASPTVQAWKKAVGHASPETLVARFADNPVPAQRLEQEVGRPRFTRVVTKAAAVLGAMVDGAPHVPVLGPIQTTLRTVTLWLHRLVEETKGERRPTLITGLVMTLIAAVAAAGDAQLLEIGAVGLLAIGLPLIALSTWGARSTRAWSAAGAGLLVAALALFGIDRVRDEVFGAGSCKAPCRIEDRGVIADRVLPWLTSSGWNILVVLVGLGLALGVAGARQRRLGARSRPCRRRPRRRGRAGAPERGAAGSRRSTPRPRR